MLGFNFWKTKTIILARLCPLPSLSYYQDGRSATITAPSGPAQQRALQNSLRDSELWLGDSEGFDRVRYNEELHLTVKIFTNFCRRLGERRCFFRDPWCFVAENLLLSKTPFGTSLSAWALSMILRSALEVSLVECHGTGHEHVEIACGWMVGCW